MPLETWALFLLVGLAPAVSPGPAILFAITTALRHGPRATLFTGALNALGLVVTGAAVGFGLAALMTASMLAFWTLKLVGGAYLVWLGIKLWRDRGAFLIEPGAPVAETPWRKLGVQALAISLTNPKALVLLAALFPPFLSPDAPLAPQVWILAVSYAGLCFLNHALIAFMGGWLRRFLTSARRAAMLRRATGGIFIGFGAALAAAGRP